MPTPRPTVVRRETNPGGPIGQLPPEILDSLDNFYAEAVGVIQSLIAQSFQQTAASHGCSGLSLPGLPASSNCTLPAWFAGFRIAVDSAGPPKACNCLQVCDTTPACEGGAAAMHPEPGTTMQRESIPDALANRRRATELRLEDLPGD